MLWWGYTLTPNSFIPNSKCVVVLKNEKLKKKKKNQTFFFKLINKNLTKRAHKQDNTQDASVGVCPHS